MPALVAIVVASAIALLGAAPGQAQAGTTITAAGSPFGTMLWGPKRQAVYIFDRDSRSRSNCRGSCAKLWPPVYTSGRPVAGTGVRSSLLGSIRRGKKRQVTYNGWPLYYTRMKDVARSSATMFA